MINKGYFMAKKKADDFDGGESGEATMTVEITKKIDDLIYQKKMIFIYSNKPL